MQTGAWSQSAAGEKEEGSGVGGRGQTSRYLGMRSKQSGTGQQAVETGATKAGRSQPTI